MTVERSGSEAAARTAAQAETVVVFAGSNPVINGKEEMDRPDLGLPPSQIALIEAVRAVNPRVALVLVAGYPYTLVITSYSIHYTKLYEPESTPGTFFPGRGWPC